ncbi:MULTISPECIES: MFS transporter [Streptomyces]|uniref:MFS transporter n=1 Tax=Streptomyces koelreuteriae TaxID=2838015 RepID=A0ABX8FZQ7_9ACTN|nr:MULTISPECIES: MFS transporter [Streptomyces]QWB26415.1 MFS transporter [Streptomyces koelreuteriae]UUA09495.1 MFS transporter [Streptomyces koelreuteriae]UUA17099.1 MFS transporter [Streptomyces sp. CRCS-T-1]
MTIKSTWPLVLVLRDRNAGLYLSSVVVSGFGTSALWLASGVWVKDLTGSDGLAALCVLAMWLPTLAGPLLGTLADRGSRKPLLIGVNLLLAALLLTLVSVDAPGDLWLLYAVLFLYGAAGVVQDAAESALVADAVDPSLLGDFNGLRMTAAEGMKLLAPLAGAGLYAAYGGASVALLDAATFVLATGLYALLRVRERQPAPPTGNHRKRTAEGARHLWSHPVLRPLVLAGGATMLCAGVNGAMVYAVVDGLGHSPAYAGVLYAVQGAGSVAIGLLSGTALRRLGARRFAAYGIALLAVAVALRAVPSDPLALVSGAAIGAGLPAVLIATLTSVQRETPGPLLGRVTATANTLVYTPNVLGLATGATLVELTDHRLVLVALGGALLLTATPLFRRQARAERSGWRAPSDADAA